MFQHTRAEGASVDSTINREHVRLLQAGEELRAEGWCITQAPPAHKRAALASYRERCSAHWVAIEQHIARILQARPSPRKERRSSFGWGKVAAFELRRPAASRGRGLSAVPLSRAR